VAEPAFISGALLWPAFAVAVVVAVWFLRLKLVTEVRDDGLFVCFVWLWPERTIPWDQIRAWRPAPIVPSATSAAGECAGRRGASSITRAATGARLVLASGERVLIGSQRADELARAIAERSGLAVEAS
jgi:hypothetical protein